MNNIFQISKDDEGMRLHRWMRKTFPDIGLSALHRFLRTKKVKLNNKRAKGEEILAQGDEVRIFFIPGPRKKEGEKKPITIPKKVLQKNFPILFEDDNLVAINKPAGISVHPGTGVPTGRSIIELASAMYPNLIIRLIHRLDKDTSGVLLLGKDGSTVRKLLESLKKGCFEKQYIALVFGKLPQKNGTINIALKRQESGKKMISGSGKKSITHYHLQKEFTEASLVDVLLETGRTHQIRAHFAAIGNPLVGDNHHGDFTHNKVFQKTHGLKRQFLHAQSLSFPHPETKKTVTIHAPLPENLRGVLEKMKK